MSEDDIDFIKLWFEKADHDIKNARIIISTAPDILDTACFHCQQAVEKYLKAFLLYKKRRIEKTHMTTELQIKCSEIDIDFAKIDLKNLEDFAVDIRYPDDSLVPTLDEAKEYLQIADNIKELVIRKVLFT